MKLKSLLKELLESEGLEGAVDEIRTQAEDHFNELSEIGPPVFKIFGQIHEHVRQICSSSKGKTAADYSRYERLWYLATESIDEAFALAIGHPILYVLAYKGQTNNGLRIDSDAVARWLKIDQHPAFTQDKPDVLAQAAWLKEHPDTAARLIKLLDRIVRNAIDELDDEAGSQARIEAPRLLELLDDVHMPAAPIKIPFLVETSACVVDLRVKRPEATPSAGTAAQVSTAPAVLQPDHRARADALEAELQQVREQLERRSRVRDHDDTEAAQWREMNRSLKARVRRLETTVEALQRKSPAPPEAVVFPDTWNELQAFADRHLSGRVTLTAKAIRAARGSVFEKIPFAYEVLYHLACDYVPMRRGVEGARERWESTCERLRIRVGGTGEAAEAHRTKAAYRVQHLGKTLTLDEHVQGSSARDPREGFRLYFAWMDTDQDPYLVVGSFPSHLDSSLS